MTGYEFYCAYHAVKLHFTTDSYDYFKYNGKTKANPLTFEKRNDIHMFHRLARTWDDEEVLPFLVSNFLSKNKCWTKDLLGNEATEIYTKWKKIYESLTYTFEQDVEAILDRGGINDMLASRPSGEYPKVFTMMQQNEITLETLVILNALTGCMANWDKWYAEDYIYTCVSNMIKKYTPFLHLDLPKFKNIVRKHLTPVEV